MLSVHSISKTYGIQNILKDVTFNLNAGEKAALVGPNGCGKTTLLRILTDREKPDSGGFSLTPSSVRIGYLPQGADLPADKTLSQYLSAMQGDLPALTRELEQISSRLVVTPVDPVLHEIYDSLLARLTSATESVGRVPALLSAFGLDAFAHDLPLTALSGGQKTRLLLAGVLLSDPDLLLLDEPTNHLDIGMLEWLEDWLQRSRHAVLLVSHDRTFLDRVAGTIHEIDPLTHKLKTFAGNYSDYLAAKAYERQRQQQAYVDQQDEIARLRASASHMREIADFKKGGKADSGDKFAAGFFANRSLGTNRRRKSIESRIDRLLNEDHIDKPRDTWKMKLEFNGDPESGRDVVVMKGLDIGYDKIAILTGVNAVLRHGQRVVLSGPNGCGKTTLMRTIAGSLQPLSGICRLGSSVRAGFMTQEQEELKSESNALQIIQAVTGMAETETRTLLHKFLFSGDEVFTPVGNLSFGQRARLSLGCLVAQGCNLLLLDEPLNHLDLPSRDQFEQALSGYEGTILVVTHDRYFIERVATHLWEVRNGTLVTREA